MASDLDAKGFTVDQTMELAADAFNADLRSSNKYTHPVDGESVKLSTGLIHPQTGVEHKMGQLVGSIDTYTLRKNGNTISCSVAGRDNMWQTWDKKYNKLFLRTQPEPGKEPTTPYAVGTFMASEIARDVVTSLGLSLSWGCRDYAVLEDFDANGTPLSILQRLTEPWCQVEPLKVDIFCQGTTVFLRTRLLAMTPDYTFTIRNARINDFSIAVSRGIIYGTVSLSGRLVPKTTWGVDPNNPNPEEPSPPSPGEPVRAWELETSKSSEAKDPTGKLVVARTLTTTTWRMPDKIELGVVETTFTAKTGSAGGGLRLTGRKIIINDWEDSKYNDQGRTNNPRQTKQVIKVGGIHKDDKKKVFRDLTYEETLYGRDEEGYRDITNTTRKEVNLKTGKMQFKEQVVKTLRDKDRMKVEQITSVYKQVKRAGTTVTEELELYLANQDVQESPGFRPEGPPAPPAPTKVEKSVTAGGGGGPMVAIVLEQVISSDARAKDVSYSNPSLTEADLVFIMAQFVAASGLWRRAITLSGVAMPFIRKGSILSLTGLLDENDAVIPLSPALVTDVAVRYDEASQQSSMIASLTAQYWGTL
jgi:hypothetical protein